MTEDDVNKIEKPSKSQRKRDMLDLQKMGEILVKLPKQHLATMQLPEELIAAIHFMHTLTTHEAKRRQLQYIGKLMRNIDPEPIRIALRKMQLIK